MKLTIEHRPSKRDSKRPWVILMDAHPKPLVIARCDTQEVAQMRAELIQERAPATE